VIAIVIALPFLSSQYSVVLIWFSLHVSCDYVLERLRGEFLFLFQSPLTLKSAMFRFLNLHVLCVINIVLLEWSVFSSVSPHFLFTITVGCECILSAVTLLWI
jgi:hypothetical protein